LARANGVTILENTNVRDIVFDGSVFTIELSSELFFAKMVCGCFGKRSNLDIKWKRPFSTTIKNKLNNYIGVKYHVRGIFPEDSIVLHNFKNGYCGLVKIEDDHYNLCYLTSAANLKKVNGDIKELEKTILGKNPHLKKIFSELNCTHETPLTISQISFDKKSQIENHILMIGDAAGMITPLCGNGMSMALHASKLAAVLIHDFLSGKISREEMETKYTLQWQHLFAKRLQMGRRIQHLFSHTWLTSLFLTLLKPFPFFINALIKKTHGQSF
jgi:flavin-dependent dehydrogenase